MRAKFGVVVALLGLAACATARPPGVRITDIAVLAGTYTGNINEFELPARPVRMVFHPDGSFEITAAEPRGFRFNGRAVADGRRQPDLQLRSGPQQGPRSRLRERRTAPDRAR